MQLFDAQWAAEQVALALLARQLAEGLVLFVGFHPLGNHGQVEGAGESNDGGDELQQSPGRLLRSRHNQGPPRLIATHWPFPCIRTYQFAPCVFLNQINHLALLKLL